MYEKLYTRESAPKSAKFKNSHEKFPVTGNNRNSTALLLWVSAI